MTKKVEAWAIVDRNGELLGIRDPLLYYDRNAAEHSSLLFSEKVVKVTITYELGGDGDEG